MRPGLAASTRIENFFAQMAVEPEDYLAMYPEFLLPEEQNQAWLKTRTGAVVGRSTATRFGFKIGDKVPIQATFWVKENGSRTWEFDIVGIYDGAPPRAPTPPSSSLLDDYVRGSPGPCQGQVGWYMGPRPGSRPGRRDRPRHRPHLCQLTL